MWNVIDPNYALWSAGVLEYWSVEEGLESMDFFVFGFSITPVLHYSTTPGPSHCLLSAVCCLLIIITLSSL